MKPVPVFSVQYQYEYEPLRLEVVNAVTVNISRGRSTQKITTANWDLEHRRIQEVSQ
jgi:hypothetical protein